MIIMCGLRQQSGFIQVLVAGFVIAVTFMVQVAIMGSATTSKVSESLSESNDTKIDAKESLIQTIGVREQLFIILEIYCSMSPSLL